jgi:hypothetical protein
MDNWRAVSARFLALLLVLLMTPLASEATELALQAFGRAPAAHHVTSPGPSAPHDSDCEHGCSGLFHACGCHSTAASTTASAGTVLSPEAPPARIERVPARSQRGRGNEPPPIRPPIA